MTGIPSCTSSWLNSTIQDRVFCRQTKINTRLSVRIHYLHAGMKSRESPIRDRGAEITLNGSDQLSYSAARMKIRTGEKSKDDHPRDASTSFLLLEGHAEINVAISAAWNRPKPSSASRPVGAITWRCKCFIWALRLEVVSHG